MFALLKRQPGKATRSATLILLIALFAVPGAAARDLADAEYAELLARIYGGHEKAAAALLDFLLLPGLCEWLETTEELDQLLPPPSGMTRGMAGLMRLSL